MSKMWTGWTQLWGKGGPGTAGTLQPHEVQHCLEFGETQDQTLQHKGLISICNSSPATAGEHMEGSAPPQEMPPPTITGPLPNLSCWRMLQAAERSPQRLQTVTS